MALLVEFSWYFLRLILLQKTPEDRFFKENRFKTQVIYYMFLNITIHSILGFLDISL